MSRNPSGLLRRVAALAIALTALAAIPGFAFAPTILAPIDIFTGYAIGSLPGGGYLLVWKDQEQLKVRRISATGFPGPLKTVATVDVSDNIESVAVSASGAWESSGRETEEPIRSASPEPCSTLRTGSFAG